MQYRHEIKYRINNMDMAILKSRLSFVMKEDPNAVNGTYKIRSLYFDTADDESLKENLSGISKRAKYRIRYYGNDIDHIILEKKCKDSGLGWKENANLSKEEVALIIDGDYSKMPTSESELVKELYNKIIFNGLKPVSIVDYERAPYIYEAGNVRVTLDFDIRRAFSINDFFDRDCPSMPIYGNESILEVKWDNYLPDIIKDIVTINGRYETAFSKYVSSRMFE